MSVSKYMMGLSADARAKLLAEHKRQGRRERNMRNEAAQGNEPEGLSLNAAGEFEAECRSCGVKYELPCAAYEFSSDYSYCGRSDRCIP